MVGQKLAFGAQFGNWYGFLSKHRSGDFIGGIASYKIEAFAEELDGLVGGFVAKCNRGSPHDLNSVQFLAKLAATSQTDINRKLTLSV